MHGGRGQARRPRDQRRGRVEDGRQEGEGAHRARLERDGVRDARPDRGAEGRGGADHRRVGGREADSRTSQEEGRRAGGRREAEGRGRGDAKPSPRSLPPRSLPPRSPRPARSRRSRRRRPGAARVAGETGRRSRQRQRGRRERPGRASRRQRPRWRRSTSHRPISARTARPQRPPTASSRQRRRRSARDEAAAAVATAARSPRRLSQTRAGRRRRASDRRVATPKAIPIAAGSATYAPVTQPDTSLSITPARRPRARAAGKAHQRPTAIPSAKPATMRTKGSMPIESARPASGSNVLEGLPPHQPSSAEPKEGEGAEDDAQDVRRDARPAGVAADGRHRRVLAVLSGCLSHATRPDLLHSLSVVP